MSADARAPQRRPRRWIPLAIVLITALAIVVALVVLQSPGDQAADTPTAEEPTPSEAGQAPEEDVDSAPVDPPPPPPSATESPAQPRPTEPSVTEAPDEAEPTPGTALAALEQLETEHADPMAGYDRDEFGWRSYDHDRNGCDIRNDVLRRDLTDLEIREGTQGCRVDSGQLLDPYTDTTIEFTVGGGVSSDGGVQIDHVVAIANAWTTGAQDWDTQTKVVFANDPLNLLAVDGPTNQQKGAADAAEWLPENPEFHCPYVARQVAVKEYYELFVTPAEHTAMSNVLSDCPDEPVPTWEETATP